MEFPISPDSICPDYGRINKDGGFTIDKYNETYEIQKLGVFYDIYCVAIGKKQLAGVNLTTQYGIQDIKDSLEIGEMNETNVKNTIKYINNIKLPCIQWTGEGNYLRNIYYNRKDKEGFKNAMKLILILHTDYYDINELEYHIAIGILLGYKPERIKGFLLRNINYREYVLSRKELGSYIKDTVEFIKSLDFRKYKIMKLYPQIKLIYGCVTMNEL
jgi:hypothetical protein